LRIVPHEKRLARWIRGIPRIQVVRMQLSRMGNMPDDQRGEIGHEGEIWRFPQEISLRAGLKKFASARSWRT
jgi:hypothetical protein